MKIFISWSGLLSKKVALFLQDWIAKEVFKEEEIETFVSSKNIEAGSDWLSEIKSRVQQCDIAIVVMTRDNLSSSWLNFEAGAVAFSNEGERNTIPILVDVDRGEVDTPLKHLQSIIIDKESTKSMVETIKNVGGFNTPSHLDVLIDPLYLNYEANISKIKNEVSESSQSANFTIYPEKIKRVINGKVFVGVPMAREDANKSPM